VPGQEGLLQADGTFVAQEAPQADLDVRAGESLTVHDPSPKTVLRVQFQGRCENGVLTFKNGKRSGEVNGHGAATLEFPSGSTSYQLRCRDTSGKLGEVVASGKINVSRDSGTRPVPKAPPSNIVEVDGRAYTLVYQNLLPRVTVRWSKAPPDASGFTLNHKGPAGTRKLKVGDATYSFSSGSLAEGSHTFFFEGGGRVSRQTGVTISFDNAAATVSLSGAQAAAPGATLPLSGTALPGWEVSVAGKPVPLDNDGRFSVSATMPATGKPIVVQVSHPSRGTHLYFRRSAP
jgi:hypothetical protein